MREFHHALLDSGGDHTYMEVEGFIESKHLVAANSAEPFAISVIVLAVSRAGPSGAATTADSRRAESAIL